MKLKSQKKVKSKKEFFHVHYFKIRSEINHYFRNSNFKTCKIFILFTIRLGTHHLKDALDHQLFILALIAIFSFRDWKKVLILVTAFTIGHSLTLVLSALDVFKISF